MAETRQLLRGLTLDGYAVLLALALALLVRFNVIPAIKW